MSSTDPLLGDVTGDGEVNLLDIFMLKRAISGATTLEKDAKYAADVNGDGRINAGDILMIKRHIAGLVSLG